MRRFPSNCFVQPQANRPHGANRHRYKPATGERVWERPLTGPPLAPGWAHSVDLLSRLPYFFNRLTGMAFFFFFL